MELVSSRPEHRAALEGFLGEFNALRVARRGVLVDSLDHPAVLAFSEGELLGVATYVVDGNSCELLTLHAATRLERQRPLEAHPMGILIWRKIRERDFRNVSFLAAQASPERGVNQAFDDAGIRQGGHRLQASLDSAAAGEARPGCRLHQRQLVYRRVARSDR